MRVSFILILSMALLGSSMAQQARQVRQGPVRLTGSSFRDSRLGQMLSTISSRTLDTFNTITAGMARAIRPSRRNFRPRPRTQQAASASTQNQVIQRQADEEIAPPAPNVPHPIRPNTQRQRRPNSFRQMMDRAMGGLLNLFRRSTRRSRQIRSAATPENIQTQ
ncbi:unnamed protein product [Meganyctiphanes norvegica]|uniref:Uncharacterized protein n=1 Tax=Meganyctiphanes norvegica TaxID=48144 RepID=A0AAV2QYR2_MEGNR